LVGVGSGGAVPGKTGKREFLKILWGSAPGIAELTLIGPHGITAVPFDYPADLDSLLEIADKAYGRENVFMGVCLRSVRWPKGSRGTSELALSSEVVWVDLDFKLFNKNDLADGRTQALAILKTFPLKPSIIVRTGGGVHLYWLLKEPATANDLRRIPNINLALTTALKGDPKSRDLARVLRIPEYPNMKYSPPPVCEVTVCEPGLRYTLDDFDFLSPADPKPVEDQAPRESPGTTLPDEVRLDVIQQLISIWDKGWRHEMALDVAGMMAHAGVSETSAVAVVSAVSSAVGGDTDKRVKDVRDTYHAFESGKDVRGATSIEKMIETEWPQGGKAKAHRALDKIKSLVRGAAREDEEERGPGFTVVRIIRYQQEPPTYDVVVSHDGKEFPTRCDLDTMYHYEPFRKLFFSQHHRFLPVLKQARWQRMVQTAPTETKQIESTEGTMSGRLASVMEELLENCMAEEGGDLGVQHMPIRLDSGKEVFKTGVFLRFLRAEGIDVEREQVIHFLKQSGWESAPQRFGSKVVRVWGKPVLNGHPATPVQTELFPAIPVTPPGDVDEV
jgi:hypothetical protein